MTRFIRQIATDVDHLTLARLRLDIVSPEALLSSGHPVAPLSCRRVLTQKHDAKSHKDNEDTGHNEAHAPRLVARQSVRHKRLVHSRHDEVSDTTTKITKSASERVRRADNVLVEESGGPYLTRYEATTEDTDEESQRIQTTCVGDSASKEGRDSASKQTPSEGESRAKAVTAGAGDEAYDECCCQCDDVTVGDLIRFHLQVASNDVGEKGWKGCG